MPQILQVNYFDFVLILFHFLLPPGVGPFRIGVWNDHPVCFYHVLPDCGLGILVLRTSIDQSFQMGYFDDFALLIVFGPGSEFMLDHDSHLVSLCSRICCPVEANPAWRW